MGQVFERLRVQQAGLSADLLLAQIQNGDTKRAKASENSLGFSELKPDCWQYPPNCTNKITA